MEKAFAKAEELAGLVKEYVNTRIEVVKLNAAEKTSVAMANILAAFLAIIIFLCCLIFASIAAAIVIGAWLGKAWTGFAFVALLYLLLGILVWATREKLIRLPMMNAMIKQLFKQNDGED